MIFRKLIFAIAATLCFIVNSSAQQTAPISSDTGLLLEVVSLKGRQPSYLPVGPSKLKRQGMGYGQFGWVTGWLPPKGAVPISAVGVYAYLEDETTNISVSVLRGKFRELEDQVASYKLREGESLTVEELEGFGIQPYVIKVIRPSLVSHAPSTLNNTRSISLVAIEPVPSTLPEYKLTLNNLSEKDIAAIKIRVMKGGILRRSSMPQGEYGAPLIKANESASIIQALNVGAVPGGRGPVSEEMQIVIEALIFSDGSYEGDAKTVGNFLAFDVGRRTELKRMVKLFGDALAVSDARSAPDKLHSQLSSLSYEADESELASLVDAFPMMEKRELQFSLDAGSHEIRKAMLDKLKRLEAGNVTIAEFGEWVLRTRQLYSKWMANLYAINVASGPGK